MPKKKQKYADLIYVAVNYDGDEEYLSAYFDTFDLVGTEENNDVGIYQFVKTAKVRTKIEVV